MSELKLPLTLVGISLVIYGVYGFILAGPAAGVGLVLALLLHAVIAVVLGVAACFITAYILGTDFGTGAFKNCWYVEECFDTAMPS